MRKLAYVLVGIVVLAVLAVGGYFGTLYYVGSQLKAGLDQALTRLPAGWKATYKDARVASLFPRQLVVTGMEMHRTVDAPIDATIDEIDIANPPWPSGDPAAAIRLGDSMTFKNTVMRTEGDEVKIATIQMVAPRRNPVGTAPAPALDLPPELAEALADFDRTGFDSLTIDDIAITGGNNGPVGGIKEITVGALDHGALNGAIAISGFSMHGPAPDKTVIAFDRFEIAQPNFRIVSDWQKLAADPSKLTPDTALPIFQAITMKGLAIDVEEPATDDSGAMSDKITMASQQLSNLRVYPAIWVKNGGQAVFEQATNAFQHMPESFDPEALLPLLRVEAAILVSFGYSATVDGIDADIQVPAEDSVEHVRYALKHEEIANYDRGRLERLALEGLVTKIEPGADSSIDKIELVGLDVRDACQRLASGAALDPSMLDGVSLARFGYSGLSVKTDELTQPVTLGSMALSNIAFSHGMPASIDFAMTGARVTKAQIADPDALEAFTKLGIDTLTTSFTAGYKWDPAKQAASLHDVKFKIDELGALDLKVDFTGIGQPEQLEQTARFQGATAHYQDASGANRILKVAAEESGADPAAFRKQIAAMLPAQAKAVIGTSPAATAAVAAVQAFLADPHDLTVQLAPPQPIGFEQAQLLDNAPPPKIFQALGVKVTANQATK